MSSVYCGGASARFISNARQIVAFIPARAPNLFEYGLLTKVNPPILLVFSKAFRSDIII